MSFRTFQTFQSVFIKGHKSEMTKQEMPEHPEQVLCSLLFRWDKSRIKKWGSLTRFGHRERERELLRRQNEERGTIPAHS